MVTINYGEFQPDPRIQQAIERGVDLAEAQGYDVSGLTFHQVPVKNGVPDGAGAQIMDEPRSIAFAVDKTHPNFADFLSQLTVHEINHLEREKYSRIETLEEVLVSEGLAQKAEQVAGFDPADVSLFSSGADRQTTIESVRGEWSRVVVGRAAEQERNYDYYFGRKSELPDGAGYALGLEMVQSYMDGTGATLQQAIQKPASEIADFWRNTL